MHAPCQRQLNALSIIWLNNWHISVVFTCVHSKMTGSNSDSESQHASSESLEIHSLRNSTQILRQSTGWVTMKLMKSYIPPKFSSPLHNPPIWHPILSFHRNLHQSLETLNPDQSFWTLQSRGDVWDDVVFKSTTGCSYFWMLGRTHHILNIEGQTLETILLHVCLVWQHKCSDKRLAYSGRVQIREADPGKAIADPQWSTL